MLRTRVFNILASFMPNRRDQPPQRASTGALFSWALYDWANSSFPTVIQTFVFAAYFTRRVAADETVGTAQWGYAMGAAGLVVAVGGPLLGAVTDQVGRRKPWIVAFTLACVAATALLWFIKPGTASLWPALLLAGLGTVAAEFGVIFYNAMLPTLAPPDRVGRWSGWAWGLGYAGGLACLLVALFAFVREGAWFDLDRETRQHVRITFPLVAVWFLVFSLPIFLVTPDAPATGKRISQAVRDGGKQLADSLREIRRYAPVIRFLIARMIYIDGLATLFVFGGVYAAGTFQMAEQDVLWFGVALNVTAGLGAAAFAWIDDWIGGKRTIIVSLVGMIVPGIAILLVGSVTLFWTAALTLGIFVGPVQAASRSYMARIAPEHLQNQMFGLYAFSGKATAFLGPLLVGWITYLADSQRVGMSTIVVFFAIGLLLMLTVPEAGK